MPNIKAALAAGYRPSWAIRGCLLPTVGQWSKANGLDQKSVSALINGSSKRPHEKVRRALVETLRVERWWLDELLEDIRLDKLAGRG